LAPKGAVFIGFLAPLRFAALSCSKTRAAPARVVRGRD
jgi:hypothetical protein